jgi:hypothetical protein
MLRQLGNRKYFRSGVFQVVMLSALQFPSLAPIPFSCGEGPKLRQSKFGSEQEFVETQ